MTDEKPALLREFTYKGLWWLPDNPEKQFWGTLKYAPYDGTVLELMGNLEHFTPSPPIILGMALNGKPITLFKCNKRGYFGNLTNSILQLTEYFINIVLIGVHFVKIDDIKLRKISVHYSNLDEWLNIPIFYNKHHDAYEFHIKYDPKSIPISLNNEWKLSIDIRPIIIEVLRTSATFKQKAFITFESSVKVPLADFFILLKNFRYFLSLAFIGPVYPLIIIGEVEGEEKDEQKIDFNQIEIYMSDIFYGNIYKIKYKPQSDMLFTFKDIKDNYEFILRNWFEQSRKMKLCFDFYFSIFYNQDIYLEHEFISLFQSFESYLQHKKCVKPNMKKEMKEIIRKYSKIIDGIIDCDDQFINNIIISRHYLIHSDLKKEFKSIKGGDLFPIIQKLKILFMAFLLGEIGFSMENVRKLFEKNIKIKRLIELELIKWDF